MRSQSTIVVLCAGLLAPVYWVDAAPLGTGFTYQGQLKQNGSPCNGTYDLQFTLFDSATGGAVVGAAQTVSGVTVTGGQFTALLNAAGQFGSSAFDGNDRWLQIDVRPTGGGSFTALLPRQELTATPYASAVAPNAITSAMLANDPASLLKISGGELSCTMNPGFVGVNGAPQLWPYNLGVRGSGNPWCGMYLESDTPGGWPVYDYRAGGKEVSHWMDGTKGDWHLSVGGMERLTILADGNIGIGTTNPYAPLHVRGDLAVGAVPGSDMPGAIMYYDDNDHGTGITGFQGQRYGSIWSWEHRYYGDVIIPQMRLDQYNRLWLYDGLSTVGNASIQLNPRGDSYINAPGNVGIGSWSPGSRLTVGGVVESTSGGFKFPDDTIQTTAAAGGLNGGGTANFVPKFTAPTTIGNSAILDVNGNIGMGTTTPDARLHVAHNGAGLFTSPALQLDTVYTKDQSRHTLKFDGTCIDATMNSVGTAISLNHSSQGDVLLANGGGNVGIGTTVPDRPLVIRADTAPGWPEWIGLQTPSGAPAWHLNNLDGGFNLAETGIMDGRIFVAPGGNVGLGTTTPGFPLTFQDTLGDKISLFGQSGWNYGIGMGDQELQIHTGWPNNHISFGWGSSADFHEVARISGPNAGQPAFSVQGNVEIRSASTGAAIIQLGEGLDYAEGFNVSDAGGVTPGTVLVIDPAHPGKLAASIGAYDHKVAGIVAGANGLGSAVRLGVGQFDRDVALAGRVYCNVDAAETGVEPGDLLTTSSTPGHAMKATDSVRAQGAILGKAMEPLKKGMKGQILVLVTLQ